MKRNYRMFRIGENLIQEWPGVVAAIMRDMVVLKAEMLMCYDAIEYHAYHPEFSEVPHGYIVPHVELALSKHEWGFEWHLDNLSGEYPVEFRQKAA